MRWDQQRRSRGIGVEAGGAPRQVRSRPLTLSRGYAILRIGLLGDWRLHVVNWRKLLPPFLAGGLLTHRLAAEWLGCDSADAERLGGASRSALYFTFVQPISSS